MKPTPAELAARAVIRHIVTGRDQAVQISAGKLAEIAALQGMGEGLPPLSAGMDQLWRDYLVRALTGRTWTIERRLWRVRCPWGGNFHLVPVPRRRKRPR